MRRRSVLVMLPVAIVLVFASTGRSKRAKPQPCPGGRYIVTGGALVTGDSTDPIEPVVIGNQISIGNACEPVHAKLKATKRGTTVTAAWPSCAGLEGKVKLKGTLDPTCMSLTGTLIARKSKLKEPFVAQMTRCGDGIVDPGNDEQCDGGACPDGAGCAADCTCSPLASSTTTTTATTTTTTRASSSSSTTNSSTTSVTTSTTIASTTSTLPSSTSTTSSTLPTTTTSSSTTSSSSPSTTTSTSSTTTSSTTSTSETTTTSSTTTTTIGTCTQGTTNSPFVVSFTVPDSSVLVQGLTLLVDYPETEVTIPGSGNAVSVRQTLINVQPGALSSPFDLDNALREQIAGTANPLTPGNLFTINFFDCLGATPPTPADFTCTVEVATDPLGLPDEGVTCTVSAP